VKFGSILAIYLLIWSTVAFAVLPWGVRTSEETGGDRVPGQADSAPAAPNLGRKALWTTAISCVIFALFYANYVNGWIGLNDIVPWLTPPHRAG
jgi:predicted secreted protein